MASIAAAPTARPRSPLSCRVLKSVTKHSCPENWPSPPLVEERNVHNIAYVSRHVHNNMHMHNNVHVVTFTCTTCTCTCNMHMRMHAHATCHMHMGACACGMCMCSACCAVVVVLLCMCMCTCNPGVSLPIPRFQSPATETSPALSLLAHCCIQGVRLHCAAHKLVEFDATI